jgi:predicted RNA-binding protein YlxR (DUF448 family)
MEAAQSTAPDRTERSLASERKCLVTGELRPKAELLRFVVSPDHIVTPDLAQNLPGRGLWVTAEREAITAAARKNLFSKAAKQSVKADPGLADEVARLMRKRALDYLGLARRAGIAVLGQPQVEAAVKAGKLAFLFIAADATQRIDGRKSVPQYQGFTRDELGGALGHDQIVYAGLKPHPLAKKLAAELARMEKIASEAYIPSSTDSEKQ